MDEMFSKKLQAELSVLRPFHGDCTFEAMIDEDGVQAGSGLDWRGRELPDGTPLAPPVGFSQGPSLVDFIHRTIRNSLSRAAEDSGFETEEEADDFEVGDDFDPNVRFFEDAYEPYAVAEKVVGTDKKDSEASAAKAAGGSPDNPRVPVEAGSKVEAGPGKPSAGEKGPPPASGS